DDQERHGEGNSRRNGHYPAAGPAHRPTSLGWNYRRPGGRGPDGVSELRRVRGQTAQAPPSTQPPHRREGIGARKGRRHVQARPGDGSESPSVPPDTRFYQGEPRVDQLFSRTLASPGPVRSMISVASTFSGGSRQTCSRMALPWNLPSKVSSDGACSVA